MFSQPQLFLCCTITHQFVPAAAIKHVLAGNNITFIFAAVP